jgi:radical SAM superfamily enzyme YgiQ (UPF0313 family)
MREKILVVNPPVLSPRPLPAMEGLMGPYVLTSYLREKGKDAEIFDFIQEPRRLDGFEDVRVSSVKRCGNFEEERLSKRIYQIGLSEEKYINFLRAYKPNEVWISCLFTFYWQGAKIVYDLTREFNPLIKIKLGGAYPTLATEHAIECFPDAEIILSRPEDPSRFADIDISLYRKIPRMFPILTSLGCPYACKWCAVPFLEGGTMKFKDPVLVVDDIEEKFYYGIETFRFLDSHLLADYENHFEVILEEIIRRNIKAEFYSYGGLNPLFVTQEMLELMARAGFTRIQLPIETVNEETLKLNRRPVSIKAWLECVKKLKKISCFEVVSYLLCGMPDQSIKEVYSTINFLEDNGVTPAPLFFTPIPATSYEEKRPLEDLHPFLFPCASSECPAEELEKICLNYHATGEKLVSDMLRGDRHIYDSGPSIPIGGRR